MSIPAEFTHRHVLHDEVHARPYETIQPPSRVSYLALLSTEETRQQEHASLEALCQWFNCPLPPLDSIHLMIDLGAFRLKWERHSEFTSYMFIQQEAFTHPFENTVIDAVPQEWLQKLPGEVVMAAHMAIMPRGQEVLPSTSDIAPWFGDNYVLGSQIGDGVASAFTDFRIHGDGFSRFLIFDRAMTHRQTGRMVQRLFEIEIYRMMALLALPVARELRPILNRADQQLVKITKAVSAQEESDEALLDELTHLAATVENALSNSYYRFTAAQAYHALVVRRIDELRENRIQGMQTFREFMDRRLVPAMDTCEAVSQRQELLSKRVNRASQLLRTRVDIHRERHNQDLLASMNKRAQLQLRLQETVEGLSIVAITYYAASLVGYLAKTLKALGVPLDPNLVMGVSIPIIAIFAALGVRHIREAVTGKHKHEPDL